MWSIKPMCPCHVRTCESQPIHRETLVPRRRLPHLIFHRSHRSHRSQWSHHSRKYTKVRSKYTKVRQRYIHNPLKNHQKTPNSAKGTTPSIFSTSASLRSFAAHRQGTVRPGSYHSLTPVKLLSDKTSNQNPACQTWPVASKRSEDGSNLKPPKNYGAPFPDPQFSTLNPQLLNPPNAFYGTPSASSLPIGMVTLVPRPKRVYKLMVNQYVSPA